MMPAEAEIRTNLTTRTNSFMALFRGIDGKGIPCKRIELRFRIERNVFRPGGNGVLREETARRGAGEGDEHDRRFFRNLVFRRLSVFQFAHFLAGNLAERFGRFFLRAVEIDHHCARAADKGFFPF